MRILDVSPISNTAQMPVKQGTLQFLQDSYNEAINAVATSTLLGSNGVLQSGGAYVLYGCVLVNIAGSDYILFPGAVIYNGEIYTCDGCAITLAGTNVPVASIVTTQYTTNADPVVFTDGSSHSVHNIRKLVFTAGVPGSGLFDFNAMVRTLNPIPTVFQDSTAWNGTKTINFRTNQNIFLGNVNGSGVNTLAFDFAYAVPGATVWIFGAAPAGSKIALGTGGFNETSSGPVIINTNLIYYITAIYRGKLGTNDEASVIIRNP